MQFPEGMVSRVGSVQSGIVATMEIIYTCTFMDGLRKIAYVTLETGIHKSPKWLAFEVVTQAVIGITTKNARENFGVMHTRRCKPAIAPRAKEAHGGRIWERIEGALQFQ